MKKKEKTTQSSSKKKRRNWYLQLENWAVNLFDRTPEKTKVEIEEDDGFVEVEVEEIGGDYFSEETERLRRKHQRKNERAKKRAEYRYARSLMRAGSREKKSKDVSNAALIAGAVVVGALIWIMIKKRKK